MSNDLPRYLTNAEVRYVVAMIPPAIIGATPRLILHQKLRREFIPVILRSIMPPSHIAAFLNRAILYSQLLSPPVEAMEQLACIRCPYRLHPRIILMPADQLQEDQANLIIPGLWLGSQVAALAKGWCKLHGIDIIVGAREYTYMFNSEISFLDANRHPLTSYYRYDVQDAQFEDIRRFFTSLWLLWWPQHQRHFLIHCQMGRSRSTALVCSLLMRQYRISDRFALAWIQYERPTVNPNPAFLRQLRIYHLTLVGMRKWKRLLINGRRVIIMIYLDPRLAYLVLAYSGMSNFIRRRHHPDAT
jgi:hypothetical protein